MTEPARSTDTPGSTTMGRVTPILRVDNLDASLDYYLEQLGFRIQWRMGPVASVERDRASVMLSEGDQGHPGTWLWIAVSDADVLYEELGARGARLRHPPSNYPWGSRECQVSDLDGHVLRFGSELRPGEPTGEWLDGQGRRWAQEPDGSWRAVE